MKFICSSDPKFICLSTNVNQLWLQVQIELNCFMSRRKESQSKCLLVQIFLQYSWMPPTLWVLKVKRKNLLIMIYSYRWGISFMMLVFHIFRLVFHIIYIYDFHWLLWSGHYLWSIHNVMHHRLLFANLTTNQICNPLQSNQRKRKNSKQ